MIKIILLFFPTVLSVAISEKLEKKNYNLKEWIYNFAYYILINQFIISLVLSIIFDEHNMFLLYNQYTNIVVVKYIIISFILTIVIPLITFIVKNNFSINITLSKQKRSKG